MSDIVKELKDAFLYSDEGVLSPLPDLAADEIDRLRAENARLRGALEGLTRECREHCFDECQPDCEPMTECRFFIARAALAEQEKTDG